MKPSAFFLTSVLVTLVLGSLCHSATAGETKPSASISDDSWERVYAQRLKWWSLQPVKAFPAPVPQEPANTNWPRNFIDSFILARLEANELTPAPEADRVTLARRLSFALTGLPPARADWERFVTNQSPTAYDAYVQSLVDNPHFGERWARHWMDVVHYADTHGYEWDAPAKSAWRYRDYLIRAFNADLPIRRLWLEQIAGDLIEPRLDETGRMNESMIGPMALRLGERRHGDNSAAEGVTQEAMANIIDTVGKGFLGTTVACAQCHDHKLDAVAQQDYYSLAGIFMSTRWVARSLDVAGSKTKDPNDDIIDELRQVKHRIRAELAHVWLSSHSNLVEAMARTHSTNPPSAAVPDNLRSFWLRFSVKPLPATEFGAERARRVETNRLNLHLLADFGRSDDPAPGGWRWDGLGMKHGQVADGELVINDDGFRALRHLLPAGRWSHVWSSRLAGAIRSPMFEPGSESTFSVELAAGRHTAQSMIVDQAFHSERMQFLDLPLPAWKSFTAGRFDTLEGGIDKVPRRSYLELVTKGLNNYFPPRTAYGGLKESDLTNEHSWFGVTRVYQHPPGKGPLDELERFVPLFEFAADPDWTNRFAALILSAVTRWSRDECRPDDVRLLNEALQLSWLTNDVRATATLTKLVDNYRGLEKRIQPDRTIGSAEEWNEARNERLAVRGSYTEFGREVPRGNVRFLHDAPPVLAELASPSPSSHSGDLNGAPDPAPHPLSSGRLEFARSIASDANPLTARVFVNRVWRCLFGEGLVRTPDDFGHLGEKPSHPELLDTLTEQFIRDNWSLKRLVTRIVTGATWRQRSAPAGRAQIVDPENRLWHHFPAQRLEAEAIRDALLAVSGRLDPILFGPPIEPYRTAQDAAKRLFSGPLDGEGRRSLYVKMTLMEPPRFLALFNQPLPKVTVGRRDVTQVPDQALALLNDPFVRQMAKDWAARLVQDEAESPAARVDNMIRTALSRPPERVEVDRLVKLVNQFAAMRSVPESDIASRREVWQDAAHALFNLHEFIHVY